MPLIAIGKTEKWSLKDTLSVTVITGIAHTLSTIIIGIIVGILGYKLSTTYQFITKIAAPLILIALGLIYIRMDRRKNQHHYHHHLNTDELINKKTKGKTAIITTLAIGMFFSPCIEIEAYYFTASSIGWLGITIVSVIYFFVTIIGMLLLVYFGMKGLEKINFHFMGHHEKLVSGVTLVILGIIAFFIV
jgi:uncharacterized membrane protein YjjP (DUF1212 family)